MCPNFIGKRNDCVWSKVIFWLHFENSIPFLEYLAIEASFYFTRVNCWETVASGLLKFHWVTKWLFLFKSKSSFYWLKNNLTDLKSKGVQRSILSFSNVEAYNVPFCHLISEAMAAVMLQVIPSFLQKLSGTSLFISTDDYEIFLVCRDHCVAAHDAAFC